ncbi:endonuclease [Mycobacterium phage Yoshi]|uniref:GIY-YIG domain-containing protein n=1 Tax=Mycobacterium phage Yoshi TaxID=2920891 RepID=G1BSG2_9CAUD|nr:endonuclease [Mycobacterium phage Yoshi]AEK07806.1 hypothetical protein YOSHI_55 [Mycobacterium phage Yoshi]
MPYVLYRIYDNAGTLLYVGATTNPPTRFADHHRMQPWWATADTIKLQHLPSPEALVEAELDAIAAEKPVYNIAGTRRHGLRARKPNIRKKGEGGIFQRPNGLWVGSMEDGHTSEGKRRQKRVYGKDRETVERKLSEIREGKR